MYAGGDVYPERRLEDIQCRVLALNYFTTTTDPRKGGVAVDVENNSYRMFIEEEYLEPSGYKLRDYCFRTVRQRIRKLFVDEGVEPIRIGARARRQD